MSIDVQAIERVRTLLRSDKVSTRKEAVKECGKLLDSNDVLLALDLKTSALRAQDKIPVASWPGLAALIIGNNSAEIQRPKAVDVNAFKLFKRFVAVAQDQSRSGSSTLLLRRATKLFSHVLEVLKVSGLSTVIGAEYAAVLRMHLLSTPAYCDCAKPEDAQGLLDQVMSQLEDRQMLDRTEDSFRLMSTLQMLLAAFGSLSLQFRSDTTEFFCAFASTALCNVWDDTHMMTSVFGAVNSFLLSNGLDVSFKAAELHEALKPALVRCWKSSKLRLKEALHLYASIQLRLNKLEDFALVELDELIAGDLDRMHELWDTTTPGSGQQLSRAEHALLSLCALSQFRRHGGKAPPGLAAAISSPADDRAADAGAPLKRQKTSASLRQPDETLAGPQRALAVASLLWHEHGGHIPAAACQSWAASVAAAVGQLQESDASRRSSSVGCHVWALRFIGQVAMHLPSSKQQQQQQQQHQSEGLQQWTKTWQDIFVSLQLWLAESAGQSDAEVLHLLTTLVERGLVTASGSFRPLAELVMLRQPECSNEALALLAALASSDAAAWDDVDLRQRVLRYSLQSPSLEVSSKQQSAVLAALLGLLPDDWQCSADQQPQQRLWCTDSAVADADAQLQLLLRGEDLAREQLSGDAAAISDPTQQHVPPAAQERLLQAAQLELNKLVKSRFPQQAAAKDDVQPAGSEVAPLVQACSTFAACAAVVSAAGAGKAAAGRAASLSVLTSDALVEGLQLVSRSWGEALSDKMGIPHADALTQLGSALGLLLQQHAAPDTSSSVGEMLGALEEAFADAATADAAYPSPGARAADGTELDDFDMDLDVRGGTGSSDRPAQQDGTALRLQIAALLGAFARAAPSKTAQAALACLDTCRQEGAAPPEELELRLIEVVCTAVAAGAGDMAPEAPRLLGSDGGLMQTHHTRPQVLATVLRQLQRLFLAGACAAGELVVVLEEALLWLDKCAEDGEAAAWRWQVRVQAASTVMAAISAAQQHLPEQLLSRGTQRVCALLHDEVYLGRVKGARMLPALLRTSSQLQEQFRDAKAELYLDSVRPALDVTMEPYMETSVLALGHVALACAELEAECLLLISAHVARQPLQLGLARCVLDACAARLGYPDRAAYALMFAWCTASSWFRLGYSLQELLGVQELFAVEGGTGQRQELFLKAYAPFLVPVLVLGQHQDALDAIADALGVNIRQLLLQSLDRIYAVAYPLTVSERQADQQLARKALSGGIMRRAFSDEELSQLFNDHLTKIIGDVLLMASPAPRDAASRPFCSVDVVVQSVRKLLDGQDESTLWDEVLDPNVVAGLLSLMHTHLSGARHPRHGLQVLAPLHALLELLGSHVCEPATFRYAAHIVLQFMDKMEVQAACCSILGSMFAKLFSQQDALQQCSIFVQPVLARISECLDSSRHGRSPACGNARAALITLLRKLTLDAPPDLHAALAESDPLPPDDDLKDVERFMLQLQTDNGLVQQLLRFAARAASLPKSLRQRSLVRLTETLHQQPDALFGAADGSASSGAAQLQPCSRQVVDAIWQLVRLSSELQDGQMAALAGELLALLGPLHPSAIAFHPHALTRPLHDRKAAEPQPSPAVANGKRSKAEPAAAESWLSAALVQLHGFLTDGDVAVIKTAQSVLRRLLAGQDGRAALAKLDAAQLAHLQIFAQGAAKPADAAAPPVVPEHLDGLRSPQLLSLDGVAYDEWVCRFADALVPHATSRALRACRKMAASQPPFAELLLPHLLWDLAAHDADHALCRRMSRQISEHVLSRSTPDPQAVRVLLACLNHLRSRQLDSLERSKAAADDIEDPTLWRKVYWLDLEYLQVAQAAVQVSASFTALLYAEYWAEQQQGSLRLGAATSWLQSTLAPVDQLLLDIYETIEEPDGIYAVARSPQAKMQAALFEHEGSWSRTLTLSDSLGSQASGRRSTEWLAGTTGALQQLGCHRLIRSYCQGMAPEARQDMAEVQDESAWRLGEWCDISAAGRRQRAGADAAAVGGQQPEQGFHGALRSCLEALHAGQHDHWCTLLSSTRRAIVKSLGVLSTESTANVSPALAKLQMFQTLSEAWPLRWADSGASAGSTSSQGGARQALVPDDAALAKLQAMWKHREAMTGQGGRYDLMEPMLALRRTLLDVLEREDLVPSVLVDAARAARRASQLHHGMAAVQQLQQRVQLLDSEHRLHAERPEVIGWQLEAAKLLWAQGQSAIAMGTARALLTEAQTALGPASGTVARISTLLGSWLAHSRSESPQAILEMLQSAVSASDATTSDAKMASRAHFRLAHYADALYRNLQNQKQSPEWHTAQAVIGAKRQQAAVLQAEWERRDRAGQVKRGANNVPEDQDSRRLLGHIRNLEKLLQHDEEESRSLMAREAAFLQQAIDNYGRCLVAASAHDLEVVFRLVQLWLSLGADGGVVKQLRSAFKRVPSHKFLPLMYQMASRLSATTTGSLVSSGFQASLKELLLRLAVDHPYHSLYHLYALANGNRDQLGRKLKGQADSGGGMERTIDQDKVAAAQELLDTTRASKTRKETVAQIGEMVDLYIDLAAAAAPQKADHMVMPGGIRRRVKPLPHVPVLTAPLEVDLTCAYKGLPHFTHFAGNIKFVGGINKPKLVQAVDSAGNTYRQLVKSGNDDMRQDAVMQQFFGLVNSLLAGCESTARRGLKMITYKVVPFTPAAGLLAWVENTLPLNDYLVGPDRNSGAHQRYARPGDWSFYQCWQAMQRTNTSKKPLRQRFDEVCEHFKPVLHHFFLERFREPATWFERRLAYTRSVAVSSIAGYIIGLGDRHSHNILIDQRSADVVHIDLGIAFEQGRFLNTPELIPFRLTRDIVDGFGIAGVEGVMRRSCEETMRVLRDNREALLILIEVFIHDPLYKWAMTPMKAQQRQRAQDDGDEVADAGAAAAAGGGADLANADAERAVVRVKQKLQGLEGGDGEARAVEGQVQQLLTDAQDPDKLCVTFAGWAPWL